MWGAKCEIHYVEGGGVVRGKSEEGTSATPNRSRVGGKTIIHRRADSHKRNIPGSNAEPSHRGYWGRKGATKKRKEKKDAEKGES